MIQMTETLAYCLRLAGIRTKQIAIALSFVTSTLLISRLSNMFQAPLLGTLVDSAVMKGDAASILQLEQGFRVIIFAGFLGVFIGAFLTPTALVLFKKMILRFKKKGSLPGIMISAFYPPNTVKIIKAFKWPRLGGLKNVKLSRLPKFFLTMNIFVASIHAIGVLCSLLAGAYLPEIRSTANMLSGIVNGIATVLLTMIVDPSGARITDEAVHGHRPESDVKAVVFFLQMGKLFGLLIVAQLLIKPFTYYIMAVTRWIAGVAI